MQRRYLDEGFGDHSYLFLRGDPLLVSLPPGRVVDVEEGFVSRCDSTRSEELQSEGENRRRGLMWSNVL